MKADHPDLTQPHGAPDQKARVLEWLRSEPAGLTQLDALQHLAVARLAAVIYRLREDDGYTITTELVEMPTRYGPAQVARYHLNEESAPWAKRPDLETWTPPGREHTYGQADGYTVRSDGRYLATPVESLGQALPLREFGTGKVVGHVVTAPTPSRKTPEELEAMRRELNLGPYRG